MKKLTRVTMVCSVVVSSLVFLHAEAWSACTVEQRIELANHGYEKDEVQQACGDDEDNFWGIFSTC